MYFELFTQTHMFEIQLLELTQTYIFISIDALIIVVVHMWTKKTDWLSAIVDLQLFNVYGKKNTRIDNTQIDHWSFSTIENDEKQFRHTRSSYSIQTIKICALHTSKHHQELYSDIHACILVLPSRVNLATMNDHQYKCTEGKRRSSYGQVVWMCQARRKM